MKKNFGAKPYLFPQPVMIIATYDENGKANAMNAAWGGIVGCLLYTSPSPRDRG